MSIKKELLNLVSKISNRIDLPVIRNVYIPEPKPHENKYTEFGVVVLDDGSAGLYYAWLGDTQKGMNKRYEIDNFIGKPPLQMAQLYANRDEADSSLGLAAINAISQNIFNRCQVERENAPDSLGSLEIQTGDHLGMVGYFPSLVERLRNQGVELTIVEKKQKFLQLRDYFNITDQPHLLKQCNKVLCTASTMLNNSIDEILANCSMAENIAVVGPTASFIPDPLFNHNVNVVGGTEITDAELAIINHSSSRRRRRG